MTQHSFHGAVFIATSLDGFIARPDGDIGWLTSRAPQADDTGYQAFIDSIDTVVIGRATYETALAFGDDQWPYGGKHLAVLSTSLDPAADSRIAVHRDLDQLVGNLADHDAKRVYVDGGQVVQSFLRAGLVDEITITVVPVLLGRGLSLFGPLDHDVDLSHRSTRVIGDGFVQTTYAIRT